MKRKGFRWISILLLLSALVIPAAAAKSTVPVTVDDQFLTGSLENGVTFVPLRDLCGLLGGWTVSWDSTAQAAVAVKGNQTITARPGESGMTISGTYHPAAAVYLKNGRTYVPLRTVCEALACQVQWSGAIGGAVVTTGKTLSYDETSLYWLSRIISAESRGESLQGQIAVGNVVLNRVASATFPNSIKSVIFDRKDGVQFEPVSNGSIYDSPAVSSVAAAKAVLSGSSVVGDCLYFYAPALSSGTWIRVNRTYCTTIGCHRFYR